VIISATFEFIIHIQNEGKMDFVLIPDVGGGELWAGIMEEDRN